MDFTCALEKGDFEKLGTGIQNPVILFRVTTASKFRKLENHLTV